MGERLARFGLIGLFDYDQQPHVYVAEIHEARARAWGCVGTGDSALRDVLRLLLGSGVPRNSATDEARRINR